MTNSKRTLGYLVESNKYTVSTDGKIRLVEATLKYECDVETEEARMTMLRAQAELNTMRSKQTSENVVPETYRTSLNEMADEHHEPNDGTENIQTKVS